jgi:hypothetical protein
VRYLEKPNRAIEKRSPRELVKEAMRRANKKERQERVSIVKREKEIFKRMKEIVSEIKLLEQKRRENKMPESEYHTLEEIKAMSVEDLQEWNKRMKRRNKEFPAWSSKDDAILSKQRRLNNEFEELHSEFFTLQDKEKWLLLSIVLRSQPSLMKYV